jgi:cholesterol transport system auxiliary component
MQGIVVAGMLAALAGCGASRPVRFYTLEKPPAGTPATVNPFPVALMVGRLSAPHLLRDDRIVYGMNEVEMGVYSGHRWAEPPPEMLESMLIEQLRATGQYRSVQRLSSAARGDYIVGGRLISLNELDTPSGIVARFAIELELFQPKTGTVVWTQSYQRDEPVARKTVNDVVEALQRNVQAGLSQLTNELGQYFTAQAEK